MPSPRQRWELPGYYPVFTMEMVILHYVEIILRVIVIPSFCITDMIMKKYYPGETFNIHIQSLINIIQENNWAITTKKGKDKLTLFCGNKERIILIYDPRLLPPSGRK